MGLFSRTVGALVVAALVLPRWPPTASGGAAEAAKGKKPDAQPRIQTSPWGEERLGLQCRVKAPTEIEQGMPLEVEVAIRSHPRDLPQGARKLNLFLREAYLQASLLNPRSGKVFIVRPYDPTEGMPVEDSGEEAVPLEEKSMKPWQARFPLARLYATLPPGGYECRVSYQPPQQRTQWFRGTEQQWNDAGFWHGTLVSGPFRLRVLKETPKTQTFMLPKRLRWEGGKVRFKRGDAEEVKLAIRNGYFVGAYYYRGSEKSWYALGGPPKPDDANPIDDGVAQKNTSYTIEVFETADRPCHMWHPGPGSGGYKILWKKTLAAF
jgi:hypothetical protein